MCLQFPQNCQQVKIGAIIIECVGAGWSYDLQDIGIEAGFDTPALYG